MLTTAGMASTTLPAASSFREAPTLQDVLAQERRMAKVEDDRNSRLSALTRFLLPVPQMAKALANSGMSLLNLARQKEFLQDAEVRFDSVANVWTATWSKPRLFSFGMLLRPALLERLKVGENLNVMSGGAPITLANEPEQGLVQIRDGRATPLRASDLQRLLQGSIKSDDMMIFVDGSGNLVLRATGSQARELATL